MVKKKGNARRKKKVTPRRGIQSVGIGLSVLEALAQLPNSATLSAISKACGMSASQTHRYLASLVAAGMARHDPVSTRYDLGPSALRLGLGALARVDAFRIVDAAISEFCERTHRTVQVSALGPLGPVSVRWYAGRPPVIVSLNVGSMLPLLHSATGHVFLAFAQERLTEPLIDRELAAASKVRSIDIDALRRQVRKQRFATVQGTVIPGLRATAFPIFDLQGYAVLAVTLLSNESFDPALDETVIADLEKVCADCSRSLGGHFAAA